MGYFIYNPTAVSKFQDELYGPGMRAANPTAKKTGTDQVIVRCTVSGKEVVVKK